MFSYAWYFELLERLSGRFALRTLRDFPAPGLYLRHDIDVCPKAAFRMAQREAERGIAATYMFIPTSPLYELTEDVLRPFADLGHEVSIHFDYLTSGVRNPTDAEEVSAAVYRQSWRLQRLSGQMVKSLSFHRPIEAFLRGPDYLFGKVNAYSATLMEHYRSDSAGRWRQDPAELPAAEYAQLLTHPIWWGDDHAEPKERLHGFDPKLIAETIPGV